MGSYCEKVSRQVGGNKFESKSKIGILQITYPLMIFLPIYQDSPLQQYFGAAGESLMPTLSLIYFALIVLLHKSVPSNWFANRLFKLIMYMGIISIVSTTIFLISGGSPILYNENVYIKALKVVLQYFALYAYLCILIKSMRKLNFDQIMSPVVFTLFVMTIICLVEWKQLPYAFEHIHYAGGFPYYRIRLFTKEASATSALIFDYFTFSLYYALCRKKKLLIVLISICGIILFLTTGSKTLLASIGIVLILYTIFSGLKIKKSTLILRLLFLIGSLIFLYFLMSKFQGGIENDIENFTSTSTRLYSILIGFFVGIIIPCGVGGSLYLYFFPKFANQFMDFFSKLFPNFSLREILAYINGTSDYALTAKSGMAQCQMYWGIFGTIYLMYMYLKLNKKIRTSEIRFKNFLLAVYWTDILLLFYAKGFSYEYFITLAIILWLIEYPRSHFYRPGVNQMSDKK